MKSTPHISFSVEFGGATRSALYTVSGDIVTVHSEHGSASSLVVPPGALATAATIFFDMLRNAK
jgi:hypothetical protein